MVNHENYTYRVIWSEEDGEHVGLCDQFPSLSHLDSTPVKAMEGIMYLVKDVIENNSEEYKTRERRFSEELKELCEKYGVRVVDYSVCGELYCPYIYVEVNLEGTFLDGLEV